MKANSNRNKILGIFICLIILVVGLPAMAFASTGSGTSADDPLVVTTFDELKGALSNSSELYVKVPRENKITATNVTADANKSAVTINGKKTLIVESTIEVGGSNQLGSLFYVSGSTTGLDINGGGTLIFKASGSESKNAVIKVSGGASLNITDSVKVSAQLDDMVSNTALYNNGGTVTVNGAELTGFVYNNKGATWAGAIEAAGGTTTVKNASLGSWLSAGGNETGVKTTVYVSASKTNILKLENTEIYRTAYYGSGTGNIVNDYSIYSASEIKNHLQTNQKIYKLTGNELYNENSKSCNADVFIRDSEGNINSVGLSLKPKSERKSFKDFNWLAYSPKSMIDSVSYTVYYGLNETQKAVFINSATYDPSANYTAKYTIKAKDGFKFNNITSDKVTISNGVGTVWKVESVNSGNTINVYINCPTNDTEIKNFNMVINYGEACTDRDTFSRVTIEPYGKVNLNANWVYEGLGKDTGTMMEQYDPKKDYCSIYEVSTADGYKFSETISKDDITLTCVGGTVHKVVRNSDTKLTIYINFPSTAQKEFIFAAELTTKSREEMSSLKDFRPTAYTPADGMVLDGVWVFEGVGVDTGTPAKEYDADKDYSVNYQFKTKEGYIFAANITQNTTISNGEIWKITRFDENTLIVRVNFKAKINKISINVKPQSERKSIEDFCPISYEPNSKIAAPAYWVYEGSYKESGEFAKVYDETKEYSVVYQFKTSNGYEFANDIAEKRRIDFSAGYIWKIKLADKNTLIVYTSFIGKSDSIIDKLTINIMPKSERTSRTDFRPIFYEPDVKLASPTYWVYDGVYQTSGKFSKEYDITKDYSVIYSFTTSRDIYSFSYELKPTDIKVSEGYVWKVEYVNEHEIEIYINIYGHKHNWSKEYDSNNSFHWHNCIEPDCNIKDNAKKAGYEPHSSTKIIHPDYRKSAATKTSPEIYYEVCTVCGKKGPKTFEYGQAISSKVITNATGTIKNFNVGNNPSDIVIESAEPDKYTLSLYLLSDENEYLDGYEIFRFRKTDGKLQADKRYDFVINLTPKNGYSVSTEQVWMDDEAYDYRNVNIYLKMDGETSYKYNASELWCFILNSTSSDKEDGYRLATGRGFKAEKNNNLGDINGDITINGQDLQRLYEHLNGSKALSDATIGNVNGDSVTNGQDHQRLYEHLNGTNPFE